MQAPRRFLAMLALVAAIVSGGCQRHAPESRAPIAAQPQATSEAAPRWAVDPLRTGGDAPPRGRSLFDHATTREIDGRRVRDLPFPFAALLQRLRERAGCADRPECVRVVQVPLGRSLQRMGAAPAFFRHPRVVAAVEGEGDAPDALPLKDRLYLGYQDATGILEVISYNERAGRFEFQLVHDYRENATPRVAYARRMVCVACHQNLAPIFSRAVWQETNANPAIAEALVRAGGMRGGPDIRTGIDVRAGVDVPAAIDAATDRANLFGVWQRLWRDGCGNDAAAGRRCRAAALLAALQYRLSGERGFDEAAPGWRDDFLPVFAREWRTRWNGGLAIPNPDLPNRDPLQTAPASLTDVALAHVPARLEALQPRPPSEVWRLDAGDSRPAQRLVAGLGGYFRPAEIAALDRRLGSEAARTHSPRYRYESDCTLLRSGDAVRFDCRDADGTPRLAGRAILRGGRVAGGEIDLLAIPGSAPLHRLEIGAGRSGANGFDFDARSRGLAARGTQGRAIERIELHSTGGRRHGESGRGRASIRVVDDFAPLRDAIAAIAGDGAQSALGNAVFDRSRVFPALAIRLGIPGPPAQDDRGFAPPAVVTATVEPPFTGPAAAFAPFHAQCAGCHATAELTPANFLFGTGERVAANMRQCAPRLYARLAMWHRTPALREKVPMPPPIATPAPEEPVPPRELAALERIVAGLLRAETGRMPQLDALMAGGYERLRPCLTDG